MKRFLVGLTFALFTFALTTAEAAPLRVFIRAGAKTHGPDQHDHPRFLSEWTKLLNARGAQAEGALEFPTAEQLEKTDVLVMYCQDGGNATDEQKANLDKYTKRGGGIVVLHDAVCGNDAGWFKTLVGGAWQHGKAKFFEGNTSLYVVNNEHPITKGASNFDLDDEMYYDLDFDPAAQILASTWTPDQRAQKNGRLFPSIYNVAPQLWVYEKENARSFVSIPGHNWKTFELPNYRAILLRGIAWTGKRDNVDELCAPEELASLRYPPNGPTKPSESLSKLNIAPDFNTSLVAAEPLINKPMNIDWDPAGRMWVAETPEYPNGRRGLREDYTGAKIWSDHGGLVNEPGVQNRPGRDRISWLEDTDKDGVMDKKHVFYEGLDLVTGLVFHKDGVIVTQAPDILWLRDMDGDGVAEKVEKLYTGLGTGDTHAVINNPRWGFDGWIYATHGYSGSQHVYNADKSKDFGGIGSGVVRFKPDGSAIEQYSSKGGNTWGLTITWDNEVMWTQPTSGDLLMHTVLSEAQLARGKAANTPGFKVVIKSPKSYPAMIWEEQAYRQIDLVGSFTAAAGTAIYDGGTWPAAWNGNYFATEPTVNLVHHEIVTPDGVSFGAHKAAGREETEFITSKDMWFRPIETRIGPDGALYVVDFYNQAVAHNDTRGTEHNRVNAAVRPDRDHYFGRIWRLDHKDAKANPVPNLYNADAAGLVAALAFPNKAVRSNAQRLLTEKGAGTELLTKLATDAAQPNWARIHALWTLHAQGKLTPALLTAALDDKDAAVGRNALRLVAEGEPVANADAKLTAQLGSADPRTKLAAILALGGGRPSAAAVQSLVAVYAGLGDPWLQSAAVGVLAQSPVEALTAALASADPEPLRPLILQLVGKVKTLPADAARLVIALANRTGGDSVKQAILTTLAGGANPAWSAELQAAFTKLLGTESAGAALPLLVAWDKAGSLAPQIKAISARLLATLQDPNAPDAKRQAAAATLVALKTPEANAVITTLLSSKASAPLRQQVIETLGNSGNAEAGGILTKTFAGFEPALQSTALAQVLKRPEWARTFVAGIKDRSVPFAALGPIGVDRLRNHPDRTIAREAAAAIDEVRGPQMAEKNKVIAALLPQVEQGGDPAKGEIAFASCAVCHQFNGKGSNLAPDLTGMGTHPRAELLTHIVDPNREVDPTFAAWNFEMKDGNSYIGVVARENAQSATLRDQAGEREIVKANVKARTDIGRSLMPEGFEALGPETLRDIIAYLESGSGSKYRILDLTKVADADGRLGLFGSKEALSDNLEFKKYGSLQVGEVPFRVIDPSATSNGLNLLLLKGGSGNAKNYPQRVEVAVPKVRATALHFLGGVAGWGYPFAGEALRDRPAANVTVVYEGGKRETLALKNAVEFVDYLGGSPVDVTGSQPANLVVPGKRMRVFRKPLAQGGVIEKLIFESADNEIVPVFAAVTAENSDKAEPAPVASVVPVKAAAAPAPVAEFSAPVPQPPATASGPRVLLVGGGSSHDFGKFFNEMDRATLAELKPAWMEYTDNANGTPAVLGNVDVLIWSANQSISSETRKALLDYVAAGKSLILLHPGLWYNWNNFPEWNKQIVGGGARGHDRFGEFTVDVTEPANPLVAGLPKSFKITDELYQTAIDPAGTPIQILAQATSPESGKTFPQIWIVKHPKAKIVAITLGHDDKAHRLPQYQTLLKNALSWAMTK